MRLLVQDKADSLLWRRRRKRLRSGFLNCVVPQLEMTTCRTEVTSYHLISWSESKRDVCSKLKLLSCSFFFFLIPSKFGKRDFWFEPTKLSQMRVLFYISPWVINNVHVKGTDFFCNEFCSVFINSSWIYCLVLLWPLVYIWSSCPQSNSHLKGSSRARERWCRKSWSQTEKQRSTKSIQLFLGSPARTWHRFLAPR